MKYTVVEGENLKVGDVVWDDDPLELSATKFEVVSIDHHDDTLTLQSIGGAEAYLTNKRGIVYFYITGHTWYREEVLND